MATQARSRKPGARLAGAAAAAAASLRALSLLFAVHQRAMEPARPYDVALCTLCRIFLCPDVDANDPSPGSPLHAVLGEALLREIRRRDEAASPSLIELLRRVQVRAVSVVAAKRCGSHTGPVLQCRLWLLAGAAVIPRVRHCKHVGGSVNKQAAVNSTACPPPRCNPTPPCHALQDQVCPHGDEASPEADFFGAVKAAVGQRLALLETPDDLVAFFGALAEGVITSATSAPAEGDDGGADASSALGVYLRMVYARYTAMSFEVGRCGACSVLCGHVWVHGRG